MRQHLRGDQLIDLVVGQETHGSLLGGPVVRTSIPLQHSSATKGGPVAPDRRSIPGAVGYGRSMPLALSTAAAAGPARCSISAFAAATSSRAALTAGRVDREILHLGRQRADQHDALHRHDLADLVHRDLRLAACDQLGDVAALLEPGLGAHLARQCRAARAAHRSRCRSTRPPWDRCRRPSWQRAASP